MIIFDTYNLTFKNSHKYFLRKKRLLNFKWKLKIKPFPSNISADIKAVSNGSTSTKHSV